MSLLSSLDWSPLLISLKTAAVTMIIVFVLGVIVAWRVIRIKNEYLKLWIDGLLTLPLVLPPTVVGFILLYLLGNNGPVGRWLNELLGLQIAFTWLATVITASVISFPLMYRCARAAIEQVDEGLWLAARSLAMPEGRIFYRIILPNALPGLAAGGSLAFARALGEFGATTMLAGNIIGKTRTLPQAIYSEAIAGEMDTAWCYSLVIISICLVIVMGVNWYLFRSRKRQNRGSKA